MRFIVRGTLVLGLLGLTIGCSEPSDAPAEVPEVEVPSPASSEWSVPGWQHTPADQPEGYEGPLVWADYLQGRSVKGDFNGDGVEDTAVLLERSPSDAVLEANYGDRAQAVKAFVLEYGLFVFLSRDGGEMEPVQVASRVNGIGQYGLDLRAGGEGSVDAIDFIKYDSSNSIFRWNAATSTFDEVPEGD